MPTSLEFVTTKSCYSPCAESKLWLNENPEINSAWKNCPRADWMLWALRNIPHGVTRVSPRWFACDVLERIVAHRRQRGKKIPKRFDYFIRQIRLYCQKPDEVSLLELRIRVQRFIGDKLYYGPDPLPWKLLYFLVQYSRDTIRPYIWSNVYGIDSADLTWAARRLRRYIPEFPLEK
ncbi:MAG: hypothetical protein WC551_08850 [Patescibacteria group bacterium]